MTAFDATAVHADPDGGIRWWHEPSTLDYANPVISVDWARLRDLIEWPRHSTSGHDPVVTADGYDPNAHCWTDGALVGHLTRWRWSNAEHLYRVHSYDPDAHCWTDGALVGHLTRWRWSNAERLYRVHSYDPDTDCYLLVWPD